MVHNLIFHQSLQSNLIFIGPERQRAAEGEADQRHADQQARGPLEGKYRRGVPGMFSSILEDNMLIFTF